ncbi:adenosylcobinamide-GDP ribazoletransferase [Chimaeribacter arupi]|uniref:Adenosylcobinamide-GDP ribazoletransferase n=3 Tax=Enterobacterales TaxID=91347 RepID=A0A2N5ESQ7_9GAMM|nr:MULTISPECIES: adenosylcobinamide-GDP ribazoletransferase [Yersiniaceae]MBS0970143.1 adenosylcobinamide-GDP ribazoletransferase [Nissabacter archeti]MDV5138970.1 adenosylcobinamide-GDP ribazoletransferase [Chimaeribacter arupi]PLR32945.1 adenosylcobinamide-GDP ribazoletransferase [Chimaeribacter arupi]PLR44838.1 adenosylcobinamide-GDP ribazoletransferase [Chimaeribacter arupi]PLR49408.1 adenosylcobinamide-GDP ribazoletransferase [Chimaeribacter arupi]
MKVFLATLQFLTRLPVPANASARMSVEDYPRGVYWFPVIGLIVGMCCTVIYMLTASALGPLMAAMLAVTTNVLVTGAFHLNGLADSCDGLFSRSGRARALEIMRDSRIGTYGAAAVVLTLLIRVGAIYQMSVSGYAMLPVLLATPLLSRGTLLLLMFRQNYAREDGLGNLYIGKICPRRFVLTLLITLAGVALLCGVMSLIAVAVTLFFALMFRSAVQEKIGGQTGDTLGAGNELFEIVFLLALMWH